MMTLPILRGKTVDKTLRFNPNGELMPIEEHSFERGKKEGYAQAKRELAATFSLIQKVAARLLEQKERFVHVMKPELIAFALTVSEKVIRQELSDPAAMEHLINTYLQGVASTFQEDEVKVFLSPEDFSLLEHKTQAKLHFVADPLMGRGDVRLETKSGLLNASISRQLEELKCSL